MPWTSSSAYDPNNLAKLQAAKRRKQVIGGLIFVVLIVAILISVSQIQIIREFLSRASGEEANLVVDTQAVLGPLPRPWRHLAQGGESHDWRMGNLTPQVKALNPEYIRLDHIYSFYDIVQGSPGNLTFNFSKLDLILDDIKATGAKPYIALSYMPQTISKSDILDEPQRWEDWSLVIQKTVEHISGERGTSDVYYEVWNEPDLFGKWHYGGKKNYLTLYSYAVQGANRARGVQPFKIGGPAVTALYKNWFDALAKFAIEKNVRYDFFSWHRYTNDIEVYQEDIASVHEWIQAYPQLEPTLEFHITEWGHDSNVHPGYDTRYGAAQTIAGSIEMINLIDKAFIFEIQDGKDPAGQEFWGRWGLFTHQDFGGKPKPRYQALRLLDRIGDQRLQILGKGTWVKATAARSAEDNPQVVIVNYDQRSAHNENVPLRFDNIAPGSYTLTKEYLGGQRQTEQVATDAAKLQTYIPMSPNSVVMVELKPAGQ